MRATDVEPNRMIAAQTAAKAFVQDLPQDVRVGIVAFAGTASVVQPPTQNREDLIAAIDRFELQRHTAIGSGIIVSLATIFPDEDIDLERRCSATTSGRAATASARNRDRSAPGNPRRRRTSRCRRGRTRRRRSSCSPTAGGRSARPAGRGAHWRPTHGVRIFTVGFGIGQRRGRRHRRHVDLHALRRGDAEGYRRHHARRVLYASIAADLQKVYEGLNSRFVLEKKETEMTAIATAVAAIFVLLAMALSLAWYSRVG